MTDDTDHPIPHESLNWHTSSYSNPGQCIAVAQGNNVLVRDSKHENGPSLAFSPATWHTFLDETITRAPRERR
jgi:hypothetical protein